MKKFHVFLILMALCLVALSPLACTTHTPTMTYPSSATISYGGSLNFSPSWVGVRVGGQVTWDSSFGGAHTLYIDDGNGTCQTGVHTYPQTITFTTAGTYHFHCSIHAPACGTTSCTNCTGMIGTVLVQ